MSVNQAMHVVKFHSYHCSVRVLYHFVCFKRLMSCMFCCLIQYLTLCSSLIKFYADIFFYRSLFEAVADPGERHNVFKYSRTCFNRPFHFKVSRHQRPHYLTIYYYIIFDGEIYFHLKATCLLRLFPRNFKWPHKAGSTVPLPF